MLRGSQARRQEPPAARPTDQRWQRRDPRRSGRERQPQRRGARPRTRARVVAGTVTPAVTWGLFGLLASGGWSGLLIWAVVGAVCGGLYALLHRAPGHEERAQTARDALGARLVGARGCTSMAPMRRSCSTTSRRSIPDWRAWPRSAVICRPRVASAALQPVERAAQHRRECSAEPRCPAEHARCSDTREPTSERVERRRRRSKAERRRRRSTQPFRPSCSCARTSPAGSTS